MPVCPKCPKYFATARSLTFHRAQLRAACNVRDSWDTEIVSTTPANERNNHDVDDVPVASFPSDSGHVMDFDPGLAWEGLSMRALDEFLSLQATKNMPLSFWTAKDLSERVMQVFTKWMSSDGAWDMQSKIPEGSMVCDVILSSNKTNITNMCGGRVAHPLLISLANIKMKVRNKASSHTFLLLALMPIPQFIHLVPRMCSVLQERLFHQCLDIVLKPLKQAARFSRMMSDPVRNLQYCFTHLVSYIVDTPEARMLACVHGNTSPVTTAMYKDFGDPYHHPPCTRTVVFYRHVNHFDLVAYHTHFGGIGCLLNLPSSSHLKVYMSGITNSGTMTFTGASKLSGLLSWTSDFLSFHVSPQVGGRVQRDVQRYIIVVIAGATDLDVIIAIRALMEFRYLSQATAITSMTCNKIRASLQEFHDHKDALIENGFRCGEKMKHVLKHWHIPKLELMQSVVPSVERVSSILQWSADTTEHAHIEVIKDPASTTNNHNYDSQICQCLDCYEKCQLFDTALALHGSTTESIPVLPVGQDANGNDLDTYDGDECRNVLDDIWTLKRKVTNFFDVAAQLLAALPGSVPRLPHTFIAGSTAIHLNYDPSLKCIPIDTVVEQFSLPDLHGALGDYLNREGNIAQNFHTFGGQRRSPPDVHLPFKELDVWYKVHLQ
ncbi:hypothetical protein BKA83DRAFT_4128592 [Pisolithus microcarpus]|nr:hypothetical protein BKA83DRAFT_4128592 [Pisolithus microcarpus]